MRALHYFFALAISQNHPNIALEIIQQLNIKSYPPVLQSYRFMALAEMKRFQDILEILRFNLKKDKSFLRTKVVYKDAVSFRKVGQICLT